MVVTENILLHYVSAIIGLGLTLNTEDDGIGVLHVGPAHAEDGFLSV